MDTVTIVRIVAGLVAIFVVLPIFVIPYWKIFSKAGFAGALSLLMIVPVVNLVVLYVVGGWPSFIDYEYNKVAAPVFVVFEGWARCSSYQEIFLTFNSARWRGGPPVLLVGITTIEGAPLVRLLQGWEPRTYTSGVFKR